MVVSQDTIAKEVHLTRAGFGLLPAGWSIVEVNDLLASERGISVGVMYPGTHDLTGVPLIRVGDLTGNLLNPSPEFRITQTKHEEYLRTALEGGELLLTLVGGLGQCAVVPSWMRGWNAARAVAVIRLREQDDAPFVRLCLLSRPLQHLMQVWATTTVQATLNLKEIKKLPLPWPPKPVRQRLAGILGTLDDKIELNRRMNETLEAMARAIFKSWFVDFDPVRAKAEGRQPAAMDVETAALFPNQFQKSAFGPIPSGWNVRTIGQEFDLTMGQSPPGETYNEDGEGAPFYQGRFDFGFRYPNRRIFCTAPTRFAEIGDTLVSVRAPVGDINLADERCSIGRGVAAVRHKTGSRSYTYYTLHFQAEAFATFESEGTVFGSISKKDFLAMKCVVPSSEVVQRFEQGTFPLDEAIQNNEHQSRTLTVLRDALLPKLLSGEIRVGGAEKMLEQTS